MSPKFTTCSVAALLLGFISACIAEPAIAQTLPLKDQIAQHEQKLATASSRTPVPDYKNRAIELNSLASLYRQQGNTQKALDDVNGALEIERRFGSRGGEAFSLNIMGRIYSDLGDEQKALDLFNQILPTWRAIGNREGEAATLTNMGRAYSNLAQEQKALDYLNQALPMWREVGQRSGEAVTLDAIGKVYMDMSQGVESLKNLKQALGIWREVGERSGEALTLNNMGRTYTDLGQMKETLDSYDLALAIWREIGNRPGEASTLNNLGRIDSDLGQRQTALDYMNQALPIWREVGNRNGEALILNDIGRVYADLNEAQKAQDYYNQALPIWRAVGNRRGEAMTLMNMARAFFDQGKLDHALQIDYESLPIWREVKEGRGEAMALSNISKIYGTQGQTQRALASAMAALYLAREAGDPDMEGGIETMMMVGFRNHNQTESAIYWGLEAVNSYQQIRKNISGLDKDVQAAFAQSKADTYRILAELLVQGNRLGDAEQILDLLKEEELKDVVRGAPDSGAAAKLEAAKLTAAQQKVAAELGDPAKKALALEEVMIQDALLQAKGARTAEEDKQLAALEASIQQGSTEFAQFLGQYSSAVVAEMKSTASPAELSEMQGSDKVQSYLQSSLAKLGPSAMGIRVLLGSKHAYLILVTADSRKKIELKATPADLRAKALAVRDILASRSGDPRPQLAELYAMIVAPMADDLNAFQRSAHVSAPTLLWSLDDALRYLPMAALYDGQHYMVERFRNALFTPESYGHMADAPMANGERPTVLALGLSRSYGGLPALPGVMPELEAVVRDPSMPESHGVMDGKLLPNEQFTLAALRTELGSGNSFAVVHIASHFVEESGSGHEPYLMMGGDATGDADGYAWNLSAMENSPVAFHGTQLLTLSACSTGKDYTSRDGVEMDSLGMIAQQKDAEAVLATLWDVNDASTSRIMSDFYGRWVKNPTAGKAEALRQAQLALLHETAASAENKTGRGLHVESESAATSEPANYALPYYWAPFVLIGNYQ
jgi:CHAT domain-containing protein